MTNLYYANREKSKYTSNNCFYENILILLNTTTEFFYIYIRLFEVHNFRSLQIANKRQRKLFSFIYIYIYRYIHDQTLDPVAHARTG